MTDKTRLLGLTADQFRHPLDLEATQSLKQLPGLDMLVRLALAPLAERFFVLENMASSVRVSDQQLPDLHRLLLEACEILDLECPSALCAAKPGPQCLHLCHAGKATLCGHAYLTAGVAHARQKPRR
jgi:hypothetical protein